GLVVGTEVGPISVDTWLAEAAARVAVHYAPMRQPLYVVVEDGVSGHVLEDLGAGRVAEARSVGDDLGDLASRSIVVWAEIGQAAWAARFTGAATWIATHVT